MTGVVRHRGRGRERRSVCIGVALGNLLFTLRVFVVDGQPTHVSAHSVSLQEVRGAPSATAPNKVSTCALTSREKHLPGTLLIKHINSNAVRMIKEPAHCAQSGLKVLHT